MGADIWYFESNVRQCLHSWCLKDTCQHLGEDKMLTSDYKKIKIFGKFPPYKLYTRKFQNNNTVGDFFAGPKINHSQFVAHSTNRLNI